MIIAKTLSLIQQNGFRKDYTHVVQLYTIGNQLIITGECDGDDRLRISITDKYLINDLEVMIVNFYVPSLG